MQRSRKLTTNTLRISVNRGGRLGGMRLIREVQRDPFSGVGKPEPLKHELSGCWSRRINQEHRLVYQVSRRRSVSLLADITTRRIRWFETPHRDLSDVLSKNHSTRAELKAAQSRESVRHAGRCHGWPSVDTSIDAANTSVRATALAAPREKRLSVSVRGSTRNGAGREAAEGYSFPVVVDGRVQIPDLSDHSIEGLFPRRG
jgi:Txe/YoeB family toxin of toxin-antitoxin system